MSLQKNIAAWHMRRWAGRLTWPWLAAGALLSIIVGFYLSTVYPAGRDLQAKQDRLHALQEEVRAAQQSDNKLKQLTAPGQLAAFYKFFPPERSIPDWVEKISATAAKNKLILRQGEYQVIRDKNSKLLQYQITLPVKGSYPGLRGFIDDVLREMPMVSLDNVKFERQKIGEDALVSTVMLTLHLESGS